MPKSQVSGDIFTKYLGLKIEGKHKSHCLNPIVFNTFSPQHGKICPLGQSIMNRQRLGSATGHGLLAINWVLAGAGVNVTGTLRDINLRQVQKQTWCLTCENRGKFGQTKERCKVSVQNCGCYCSATIHGNIILPCIRSSTCVMLTNTVV